MSEKRKVFETKEILKSVILRCRSSTVRDTVTQWGRINNSQLSLEVFNGTKQQVVKKILDLVEDDELNHETVGDLELVYIQLHSTTKLWKVYKLTGNDLQLSIDPRTLRSKLVRNLQLKWKDGWVFGNVGLFAGGVWLRIHVSSASAHGRKEAKAYNPHNSLFAVTFPGSPYVIINKCGLRNLHLITEAVTSTLNADSLIDIQLSGRHVASLADIVLKNTTCQSYREQEDKENPLINKQGKKRKGFDNENFEDTEMIINGNSEEKRRRIEKLNQTFGEDPQPILEKLEYKFDLKFYGKPASESVCKSTVEIKGKSVLDGLCQLARAGVLKFPLPTHLTSTSTAHRNSFMIQDKRK
ncbi:centromere protein N-like [Physella acuta]|uniref:centromere protein N-like n=1 Tax=Physella acuta TaxID=109671 RepID=UPI0027DBB6B5|nr:centromere protein N-like [Physella acuta]